jgi:hypothetical protein
MSFIDSLDRQVRLAVCIPARDQMHTATSYDLWNLAQHLSARNIQSKLFISPGTLIANQRHELVLAAKEWGATHVMFIDSDMTFSASCVTALLEQDEEIVGAAYSKRVPPFITTAWYSIDNWDTWVRTNEVDEMLVQVDCMALGFCLIRVDVFDRIEQPWFQLGFYNGQYTGEDIEFFRKVKEANIPVWLDIEVTKALGHLGTHAFNVVHDN